MMISMGDKILDSLVKIKPEEVEAHASTLRAKAALIRQYLTNVDECVNELSPAVFEGISATTFRMNYAQRREAMLLMPGRLETYAERLEAAATAIRIADAANSANRPI